MFVYVYMYINLINAHTYIHIYIYSHSQTMDIDAQHLWMIIPSASIGYFAIGITFKSKGSSASPSIKMVTISCSVDSRPVNDLSLNVTSTPFDWPIESIGVNR